HGRRELAGGAGTEEAETPQALMMHPPMALARLQPLPAGLGEAHRVQAATGNDEPIPFNRVGDASRVGLDRAQVVERLPSLRLAASRRIEFVHDAKRRLFERANFWR